MSKTLIGIHGKPRAGKDTIANYLVDKYKFLRYGASDPVKKATAAMFDINVEILYDDKRKDTYDDFWKMSYREMMQKIGKESSRDVFGEDFWMRHVDKMWQRVQQHDWKLNGMVIADIRYANEVAWIKQRGGLVMFVERPNRPLAFTETHPAEQGLDPALADVIVPNDGSVVQLQQRVALVVEPLLGDM